MIKKIWIRLISAAMCLLVIGLSGCADIFGKTADSSPAIQSASESFVTDSGETGVSGPIVIGATLASETSAYLIGLSKYMHEAAVESGAELILEHASWDAELQVQQINQFIKDKVDAIIVVPVNAKLLLAPLKKAQKAGIPVINLNMKVDSISSEYIDTYVGASSSEEAALAAEMFIEIMAGKESAGGKIAIIEGAPGSDPQIYRTQTFVEQLTPYPEIEIVAIRSGGWDRSKAKLVAADIIRKNPGLQGIYCHDSNMAIGAIEAIEELGLEEQILVVGIGEDEEYLQAIMDGRLYGLVTQPSEFEGKYSIYCAIWAAEGETLRPWYKDPIQVVTLENIEEYENSIK